MKTLVVDASVAVKWQLDDEEHIDKADAIRQAFVRQAVALVGVALKLTPRWFGAKPPF